MRLVAVLCAFAFANVAFAQSKGTTVGGMTACLSESYLDDVIDFVIADDLRSMQAYLDAGRCIVMQDGVPVTIMSGGFTKVRFAYSGIQLWTLREGVKRR